MLIKEPEIGVRAKAFHALEQRAAIHGNVLRYTARIARFEFEGDKLYLMARACGIFNLRRMKAALSVLSQIHFLAKSLHRHAEEDRRREACRVFKRDETILTSSSNVHRRVALFDKDYGYIIK